MNETLRIPTSLPFWLLFMSHTIISYAKTQFQVVQNRLVDNFYCFESYLLNFKASKLWIIPTILAHFTVGIEHGFNIQPRIREWKELKYALWLSPIVILRFSLSDGLVSCGPDEHSKQNELYFCENQCYGFHPIACLQFRSNKRQYFTQNAILNTMSMNNFKSCTNRNEAMASTLFPWMIQWHDLRSARLRSPV